MQRLNEVIKRYDLNKSDLENIINKLPQEEYLGIKFNRDTYIETIRQVIIDFNEYKETSDTGFILLELISNKGLEDKFYEMILNKVNKTLDNR